MDNSEQIEKVQESSLTGMAAGSPLSLSAVVPSVCKACDAAAADIPPKPPQFAYAIGRVSPRFSTLGAEREFAQIAERQGPKKTTGHTDQKLHHDILTHPSNRYLAREMCWVMTIEGMDAFILVPRDTADLGSLIDTVRPSPGQDDLDVVIGVVGPLSPPTMCNGVCLPLLVVSQSYSFHRKDLIASIPGKTEKGGEQFADAATGLLDRLLQMSGNMGTSDGDRAINYLLVREPAIYLTTFDRFNENMSLSALEARPSALSGTRRVIEVIFAFTSRANAVVEKFAIKVDVTDQYPFRIGALSPYYDR